jgi:hypothetical protein
MQGAMPRRRRGQGAPLSQRGIWPRYPLVHVHSDHDWRPSSVPGSPGHGADSHPRRDQGPGATQLPRVSDDTHAWQLALSLVASLYGGGAECRSHGATASDPHSSHWQVSMNVFGHVCGDVCGDGEWALWAVALCPLPVTLALRRLPSFRRRQAARAAKVSAALREMAIPTEQVHEYSEGLRG